MENGLQVALKKFNKIEKILSLEFIDSDEKLLIIGKGPAEEGIDSDEKLEKEKKEVTKFIIWDLYNTGKDETIILNDFTSVQNFDTHLARTSGNILHVSDKGIVTSVLKKVKKKLKQKKEEVGKLDPDIHDNSNEFHKIYFNKNLNLNFEPIIFDKEPWILENYERTSYCLKKTKSETLQLIVGRSTVQIWHQIHSDDKTKKDDLPNKGEPFLEYIWTNRIPVIQEMEETKLRIDEFKYVSNDEQNDKLYDFNLKVYWYEKVKKDKKGKKDDKNKISENIEDTDMDEINKMEQNRTLKKSGDMERREELITQKDIVENFHAVRHACRALEHLNKRYKNKNLVDRYKRVHEVS
jgi:hypothetical protein